MPVYDGVDWARDDWHCQVVRGEFPVDRIYENAEAIAFWAPPGHSKEYATHVYVIPKRHVTTVLDLGSEDASLMQSLLDAVQAAARLLKLDERGFFIRVNVLPPYQHTGHIHIHLYSGERASAADPQPAGPATGATPTPANPPPAAG